MTRFLTDVIVFYFILKLIRRKINDEEKHLISNNNIGILYISAILASPAFETSDLRKICLKFRDDKNCWKRTLIACFFCWCEWIDKSDLLSSLIGIRSFTTSDSFIVIYIKSVWVRFTKHINIQYIVIAELMFRKPVVNKL